MEKIISIESINTISDAINYHNQIIYCEENIIVINFQETTFIRSNFISIVGMALERIKLEGKEIKIIYSKDEDVNKDLEDIGFLHKYNNEANQGNDEDGRMIPYTHVPLTNNSTEIAFIYTIFMQRLEKHMENHSNSLQKKIFQKILEIFSNVFRHSQSELGLICSGQFYSRNKKFNFTIVDCGIGIDTSVNEYLMETQIVDENKEAIIQKMKQTNYQILDGCKSIEWAIIGSHSSTGSGGLGLSLLIDLVEKSDGALEIVSNKGYYSKRKNKLNKTLLNDGFSGTIVSLELNAEEDKYYCLKEDVK